MTVGSFGTVTFQVSSKVLETFKSLKQTSTANYQGHKVHGKRTVQEFVGHDADKLTMEITLSAFWGVNPKKELVKLEKLKNKKEACTLALGTDVYGKWLLQSISREFQYVYKDGKLLQCKVSLTMIESE